MRRLLLISAAVCAGCIWFAGCNTSGCTDNRSAIPLMGFYSEETGQAVSLDSIEVGGVGAPGDSLLVAAGERTSIVYLPFRSSASETAFFIHYAQQGLDDPQLNDTLWFAYESHPQFVSQECGAMYFYRITSMRHTRHILKRVELLDSMVTNVNIERIHVFYSTAQPDEPDETPDDETTGEDDGNPEEEEGLL